MANLSQVKILAGVPLTPAYGDTFAFATKSAQTSYFNSKVKYGFTELSYVKHKPLRLPGSAGQYRDCSYVMYQNEDYPGKWFYAFITAIEYIADDTTHIYIQEDEIQTWFFDFDFKPCFIERQHALTDVPGDNLMEETLATGEWVCNSVGYELFNDWWIIVVTSVLFSGLDFPPSEGYLYDGIYSGLAYYAYDIADINRLGVLLEALAGRGKSDAIVSMYMVPRSILAYTQGEGQIGQTSGTYLKDAKVRHPTYGPNTGTLDGYTPVNKKLLTYPYRALRVTNSAGQSVTLKYEFMNDKTELQWIASPFPNGRIMMYPNPYLGKQRNYDYAIALGDYPQCSWLQDVYSNWLATQSVRWQYTQERNEFHNQVNAMRALGPAMVGAFTGNQITTAAGVLGGAKAVSDAVVSDYDLKSVMAEEKAVHSMQPPSFGGTVGNDSTMQIFDAYGFTLEELTITAEFARSIDSFWSMCGYPIRQVMRPNIYGRRNWNYVKTLGAAVGGDVPMAARNLMQSLLDRGVRFWHNTDIGNYNLSNPIV